MYDRQLRASFDNDIFSNLLKTIPAWKLAKIYARDSNDKSLKDKDKSTADINSIISDDGSFKSSMSSTNAPAQASASAAKMDIKTHQFPLHTVVE